MTKENKKSIFISVLISIATFVVALVVLMVIGLVPGSINYFDNKPAVENTDQIIDIEQNDYIRPERVIIDKVGIDSVIEKPNKVDVVTLDQALTKGAVHYPGSGSVNEGNMFIFGHSTNWKVVQNQAYKTFNGLEKLVQGDEIIIQAEGKSFIYRVNSVNLVDEDDALVEFNNTSRTLTISTCNTFGEKQERWVVEADFVREV